MLVALITPFLSQVMPAPQAVGVAMPLLIFGDLFAVRMYWQKWDIQQVKLLLPSAVVGILAGTALLALLTNQPDDLLLRRILGLFTLSVVVYKLASDRIARLGYEPRNWHGYVAGSAAGFGSALANIGAPPFTAYMLLQKRAPQIFIGTASLFFAAVNLLKLPGYFIAGVLNVHQILSVLWSLPLILAGVWLGQWVTQRINGKAFEWFMIVVLLWAIAVLLFSTPR